MSNVSNLKPFDKIVLVRDTKLNIKPILKFVLLILTTHLGRNAFASIRIITLMRETGIGGQRHLIKYLSELEKLNFIRKEKETGRSNKYYVNLELIWAIKHQSVPTGETVPTGEIYSHPFEPKSVPTGEIHKYINSIKDKDLSIKEQKKIKAKAFIDAIRKKNGL